MVVASEADIVRRAQAGDRSAFAELYDAYLDKIYDFALGMLRNRADAEDVTSDAFLKAVERLGSLKDPDAFRGWLYTIARNSALNVVESRKRAVPTAEQDETATTAFSEASLLYEPEEQVASREMRELLWDAAAALSPKDAQVFELTVRHGLSSAEIADVLGVRPAYAYILVNRLKDSVAEALETVVLVKTGRSTCGELNVLVSKHGDETTPRARKAVARHAKGCATCTYTKETRANIRALLAGTAFAAPLPAFAAELAAKIDEAWLDVMPTPGGGSGAGGRRVARTAGIVAGVIVLTAATVGATAQRTIHRTETARSVPSPEPSASPSPSGAPSGSPSDEPGGGPPAVGPSETEDPAPTTAPDEESETPEPTRRPTATQPPADETRPPAPTEAPTPTRDPAGGPGGP